MSKPTPNPDEPELNEIEIQRRYPPKNELAKAYLVVSFDALAAILYRENSIIAPKDVPDLLHAFAGYAETADRSDSRDVTLWEVNVNRLTLNDEEEEEDDDGEEEEKAT